MKPDKDEFIKVLDVCALIKQITGRVRSRMTVYNWIRYGRRAYSGEKIRLQATRRYGQMYITQEWLETFLRQL